MAKFRLIFSTLIEWIVFTTKAFLQDMGYLREGDENTEISTGCQCQCQSPALDSSKRGTRYKTGRLTAQGDTEGTMITMVVVMVGGGDQYDDYQS